MKTVIHITFKRISTLGSNVECLQNQHYSSGRKTDEGLGNRVQSRVNPAFIAHVGITAGLSTPFNRDDG
jgi:hypothetical protein